MRKSFCSFGIRSGHNLDDIWIPEIALLAQNNTGMNIESFTTSDAKAFATDGLHNLWLKRFSSVYEVVALDFAYVLNYLRIT